MFATEIPSEFLTVFIGVSFTAVIGLMAWIVRELSRISSQSSRLEERSEDHERRLEKAGL